LIFVPIINQLQMNTFNYKGWQFVALVAFHSIILYYFILQAGNSDSTFTLLMMLVPAITALILRLYHKEGHFQGQKAKQY